MGAYYVEHIQTVDEIRLTVEQGTEIGRDGRVIVNVRREKGRLFVAITGSAVYVNEFDIKVDSQ